MTVPSWMLVRAPMRIEFMSPRTRQWNQIPVSEPTTTSPITAAVGAMNELFNALLDISKLDAGVLSTTIIDFPIARLLKRIESTFTEAAREKGLSFKLVPSSAWVRSDLILLERIVLNLVSNAVRYTASGGVLVGCRRRGLPIGSKRSRSPARGSISTTPRSAPDLIA